MEEDNDVSILHITRVTHLEAGPILCTASVYDKSQSPLVEVTQQHQRDGHGVFVTCASHLTVWAGGEAASDQSACGVCADVSMNNFGDAKEEMTEPAILIRGPQDTTAFVGDRVLLKATYMGRPEPSVRWTRAVSVQVTI